MRRLTIFLVLSVLVSPASALDSAAKAYLEHLGQMGLETYVAAPSVAHAIHVAQATNKREDEISTKAAAKPRAPPGRTVKRRKSRNFRIGAERQGYKRVSSLVNFPAFFPGIGVVYVKPDTLPVGPFLSFDRRDRLISTIYMVPLDQMNEHKKFDAAAGGAARVNHVTVYFNGGHPGVDMPHYHYVLWHVSKKNEALVAK